MNIFGVLSVTTICKRLKYMGCTRKEMCSVAKQRDDKLRAEFMAEGTMNGDRFLQVCLLPHLLPFNCVNPQSVMNASIHHVEQVRDLTEVKAGARLLFFPPYSPDLMRAYLVK